MASRNVLVGSRGRFSLTTGVRCCCALAIGMAERALAQDDDAAAPPAASAASAAIKLPAAIITGTRASLASSKQLKRDSIDIVDAVVADDLLRLPDFSVTDALQRVTGVQIARDRGDGTATAVRGLTQIETTLNGREIFTAGTGRALDLADIPAELVASLQVHKTSTPQQIEGGIGGWVDLRTRRPFDFAGNEAAFSARRVRSSLVQQGANQFSTLLSGRWQAPQVGAFGALLSLSLQDRAWREDQQSSGAPTQRSDLIAGRTVTAPNGATQTTSLGRRRRSGASLVLQWQPSESLDLYAEAGAARFTTRQDSYQLNLSAPKTFVPGSVRLFDGSSDLQSITWTNAPISVLSFARDTVDSTRQAALGGSWQGEALTLKADLSTSESSNRLVFSGPVLQGTAANASQDQSGAIPSLQVSGTNLLDPNNFRFSSMAYRDRPYAGRLNAAQLDAEQALFGGRVKRLLAGLRYARRSASNDPGLIFGDAAVTGIGAADRPGAVTVAPDGNYLGAAAGVGSFLAGNLDLARDAAALRDAFGITTPIPSAGNPLGVWHIREDTRAAYAALDFAAETLPLDGNAGVRVVGTQASMDGFQSLTDGSGTAPIASDTRYTDVLPSMNLRYRLEPGQLLRLALSKTVSRPGFDQLSPSLNLIRNSVDPSLNQGSAGNPGLAPVRSRNLDLAYELYRGASTSAHVTLFAKRVTGFVTTVSSPELHGGEVYQVSRPQSGAAADIRGVELGGQRFFDGLPGAWRGLGLQANYTWVQSRMRNPASGAELPLQNLSKNSFNLIGLYELGAVSARVAYNWRDRFLSGVSNVVGLGSLPIYTQAYGWLDASLRLRASERVTIALEGNNLLATRRVSYYGVSTRPQSVWANDVQVGLSATCRF